VRLEKNVTYLHSHRYQYALHVFLTSLISFVAAHSWHVHWLSTIFFTYRCFGYSLSGWQSDPQMLWRLIPKSSAARNQLLVSITINALAANSGTISRWVMSNIMDIEYVMLVVEIAICASAAAQWSSETNIVQLARHVWQLIIWRTLRFPFRN